MSYTRKLNEQKFESNNNNNNNSNNNNDDNNNNNNSNNNNNDDDDDDNNNNNDIIQDGNIETLGMRLTTLIYRFLGHYIFLTAQIKEGKTERT